MAAANPKSFVQLYWSGSREVIAERVERFRRAGAKGIILTLNNAGVTARDWGSPVSPMKIDLPTLIRHAPMGIGNPSWVLRFIRAGKLPDLGVPNLEHPAMPELTMVEGMTEWLSTSLRDQADVTFDSGIRRGVDVVKALALGAKSTLVGRSWFFGLAADGERGVREVLEAYRVSIDRTLVGLGKSSVHELNPDDVIAPKGYFLDGAPQLEMASA